VGHSQLAGFEFSCSDSHFQTEDVLRWVNPRIGTGGHGHCYPGATVPFGAVQLSPNTFNDGWDWCSSQIGSAG
jgi:putative alpha-1,2-mannosidase